MNQSVFGCFLFDDFVNGEGSGHNGIVLVLGDVGNLQAFLTVDVAVKFLEFRGDFNKGLLKFDPVFTIWRNPQGFGGEFASLEATPCRTREVVADNHFKRDKDPFHVPGNRSRFFDHGDFSDQTSVSRVDFNQMGFANAGFFNQLEPMSRGTVKRFSLPGDQRGDDLVKYRNLIGKSKFQNIRVIGGPNLLDFALVEHFSHESMSLQTALERFTVQRWGV